MMADDENKVQMLETFEKGNLNHMEQRLRIEYLRGMLNITPKVVIGVATTEDNGKTPRSFRTDRPSKLREIISCLIKCLYHLERDLKH